MNKTQANVEELTAQGKLLYESYKIWAQLVDPRLNSKHTVTLNLHPELFAVIAESLFGTIVTTISALCEKPNTNPEKNVLSIYSVVVSLSNLYPQIESRVLSIIRPYEPELELLSQIRHKVYSHRDYNICPESVFSLVNITPERIHSCIAAIIETIDIINTVMGYKSKGITNLEVIDEANKIKISMATLFP